ncbi:MAG: hypothetical protein ACTSUR_01665 [Candidatus Heimdallarchaeaceae archaeon]
MRNQKKLNVLIIFFLIILGAAFTPIFLHPNAITLEKYAFKIDRIEIYDTFEGTPATEYRILFGILFTRIYGSSGDTFSNDQEYSNELRSTPKSFYHYGGSGVDFYGDTEYTASNGNALETDYTTDSTYTYGESHDGWELWLFVKVQKKVWYGWSSKVDSQKFYSSYTQYYFTWNFHFTDFEGKLKIRMKAIKIT